MDGGEQLKTKVAEWLTKNGYPLEMKATRILQSKKLWTSVNWYFVDAETGEQRESDILAKASIWTDQWEQISVCLAIECKSGKDKPWILFKGEVADYTIGAIPGQLLWSPEVQWNSGVLKNSLRKANRLPLLNGYEPYGYALARALSSGNVDPAFSAMISAAKAAASVSTSMNSGHDGIDRALVIPVIVVDAPLMECFLDMNGKPSLSYIDKGTILWKRRIGTSDPDVRSSDTTVINIVTQEYLPQLADDAKAVVEALFPNAGFKGARSGGQ